jgi:hypothetical protein
MELNLLYGAGSKTKDIKAGHVYVLKDFFYMNRGNKVYVCLGKILDMKAYAFAVLQVNEYPERMDSIDFFNNIKKGYKLVGVIRENRFHTYVDCGELVQPVQIKSWLAQVRLMGGEVKLPDKLYIGDWTKRKKLDVVPVDKLVPHTFYIKEELAFARLQEHRLHRYDTIYYYSYTNQRYNIEIQGDEIEFVWYELPVSKKDSLLNRLNGEWHSLTPLRYSVQGLKEHELKKQYKDMVLLDASWKLSDMQ